MQQSEFDHQSIIEKTRQDFALFYDQLRWITPEAVEQMGRERRELLDILSRCALAAFSSTKPYTGTLSPGCRLCGSGEWSCLFINNICNARCFYCPSEQQTTDDPGTSTLTFKTPKDYVDYLEYFGFKGASISGGEPFMTFERTLHFAAGIKKHFGEKIYLWLYTNGILATSDKLKQLRDAGLDEIRFNIGAVNFSLDHVSKAVGIIPYVTIEIPAVPECLDLLARLIPEMKERGVDFLNLHQIRCTAFNYPKLAARGYTFAHGPTTGVVESELTALKLLAKAAGEGTGPGINYCSLIYRHRFQARAAHYRWARLLKKEYEDVTDTGMIRSLSFTAEPQALDAIEKAFAAAGADPGLYARKNSRLYFGRPLMDLGHAAGNGLRVSYYLPSINPGVTYRNPYREIRLNRKKSVVLERSSTATDLELSPEEGEALKALTVEGQTGPDDLGAFFRLFPGIEPTPRAQEKWKKILHAERLRSGLLEYY
jgi:pyruvate formate-lyase activating enzyme-like uncharacterized protein